MDDFPRVGPEEETENQKEPSYQQEFGICPFPQWMPAAEAGALPAIDRIRRVLPAIPFPDKVDDYDTKRSECQDNQQRDVRFEEVA